MVYSFKHKCCIGFIFPNEPIVAAQIWEHSMSVKNVEKKTGYKFFDKLGKKGERIKAKLDVSWWKKR